MALFDEYDGYGERPRSRSRSRSRRSSRPAMSSIEEESLLTQLGQGTLSTIETVGHALDTGGGFVRNRLADLTGADIPKEGRISGRQLLEQWGWAGDNSSEGLFGTGLDWGDVGGFGLEVLTDPLTYLTLGAGAATKSGKIMKAANRYPRRSLINANKSVRLGKRSARHMTPQQIMNKTLTSTADRADFLDDLLKAAKNKGIDHDAAMKMFREEKIGGQFGMFGKVGSLPGAAKLDSVLDTAGAAARYSKPGRLAGALYDPIAKSLGSVVGQSEVGPAAFAATRGADTAAMALGHKLERKATESGFDMASEEGFEIFRRELKLRQEKLPSGVKLPQEQQKALAEISETVSKELEIRRVRNEAAGLPAPELDDVIGDARGTGIKYTEGEYAPRQVHESLLTKEQKMASAAKLLGTKDNFTQMREIRGFERMTEGVHEALADGRLTKESGLPLEKRAHILGMNHMGWSDAEGFTMKNFQDSVERGVKLEIDDMANLDALQSKWANIEKQANILHKFNEGEILFGNSPIKDAMSRMAAYDRIHTAAQSVHRLNGMTAKFGGEGVDLSTVMSGANLTGPKALSAFARSIAHLGDDASKDALAALMRKQGYQGGLDPDSIEKGMNAILEGIAKKDDDFFNATRLEGGKELKRVRPDAFIDEQGKYFPKHTYGRGQTPKTQFMDSFKKEFDNFKIPADIAKDVKVINDLWTSPKAVGDLMKAWDATTNAWRASVTTMFPAFHMRNAFSEFWNNIIANGSDPRYGSQNPYRFAKPYLEAKSMFKGGIVEDLQAQNVVFKGLSDKDATRRVGEYFSSLNVGGGGIMGENIGGRAGSAVADAPLARAGKVMPSVPGDVPQGFRSSIKEAYQGGSRYPQAVQSVKQAAKGGGFALEENAPEFMGVALGRGIGQHVEDVSRMATFLAKLRQGYSPEAAAQASKFAHVDYTRLTDFERNVMRRVAPFWSWTRHQFPWQVKKFMERPGGPAGKAIRAANLARTGEYVPEWAGTGMAVKIGEDDEGNKSFISGLDLPHESILEMMSLGPNPDEAIRKTALSASSLMHPIPKTAYEYFSDTSTFRKGRKLSDLDPPLGRAVSNLAGLLGVEVDPRFIRNQPGIPGRLIEAAAMATPLSRATTTVRKAADPRKPIMEKLANVFSGVRTTTVGKKAEAYEQIDKIKDMLKGGAGVAGYSGVFLKDKEAVSPENQKLYDLLTTIQNRLKKESREKTLAKGLRLEGGSRKK